MGRQISTEKLCLISEKPSPTLFHLPQSIMSGIEYFLISPVKLLGFQYMPLLGISLQSEALPCLFTVSFIEKHATATKVALCLLSILGPVSLVEDKSFRDIEQHGSVL
jgi:hypothetical protein